MWFSQWIYPYYIHVPLTIRKWNDTQSMRRHQAKLLKTCGHAEPQPCLTQWLEKQKGWTTKTKALFCTLTQNTRQTFQFLPCQHRKKGGRGKRRQTPFAKISLNTARNLNDRGKIKLKKAFLFFPPQASNVYFMGILHTGFSAIDKR